VGLLGSQPDASEHALVGGDSHGIGAEGGGWAMVREYTAAGEQWSYLAEPASTGPLRAAALVAIAEGHTARVVADDAATADVVDLPGDSGTAETDITIGKQGVLFGNKQVVGRIYADLVLSGEPTIAELRALLTTPPWEVFAPARLLRLYIPGLATADAIPDVAHLVGGPLDPVDALWQAGGIDDVVHE